MTTQHTRPSDSSATTCRYVVHVLWEGVVLSSVDREGGNFAWAYYDSTVSLCRRRDPIDGGVAVQMIGTTTDEVLAEDFIDTDLPGPIDIACGGCGAESGDPCRDHCTAAADAA